MSVLQHLLREFRDFDLLHSIVFDKERYCLSATSEHFDVFILGEVLKCFHAIFNVFRDFKHK